MKFEGKEKSSKEGHDRDSRDSLVNLHVYLVLEVFGVVKGFFIKDSNIGEQGSKKVKDKAKDGYDSGHRKDLAEHIVTQKERLGHVL